jgi:cullin-associated NEDD8-dissociated protein 1
VNYIVYYVSSIPLLYSLLLPLLTHAALAPRKKSRKTRSSLIEPTLSLFWKKFDANFYDRKPVPVEIMSAQQTVHALLKKTSHYDKDERYMATSDLCEVLKKQSDGTLDASTERQICTAVLRLLHDKSNDVQAVAVKTLGVLLTTVQQEQVLEIAESLADQVLDASKSELRDVYAIGLRTLVKTCPAAMGSRVSQRLLGRLLEGIRTGSIPPPDGGGDSSSEREEIVLACLDVLTDLLGRFGATAVTVTRQHEQVLQMCLQQLGADKSTVVRKRAGNTLTCLSTVLSDPLLHRMVEALLRQIDLSSEGVGKTGRRKTRSMKQQQQQKLDAQSEQDGKGDTRSLIRTMCTVSGAIGHRLGQEQIDRILPILLRFTEPEDATTGDDDDDGGGPNDEDNASEEENEADTLLANELRESCFMGFESFVLRCPVEVEPHLNHIVTAALAYMSYDPNYAYGTVEEESMGTAENNADEDAMDDDGYDDEEDMIDDEEDDGDDDDDDDNMSWKTRRAAIRTLMAVVEAKKHSPAALWTVSYGVRRGRSVKVSAALVQRFKEREENCRVGVIHCFNRLLSYTIAAASADGSGLQFASASDMVDDSLVTIDLQAEYVPAVVKACEKILAVKKGNDRSKSKALALLETLCKAPGGIGGEGEIGAVFRHVQGFLSTEDGAAAAHREGTSKALRLDALSLVRSILATTTHDPVHIRKSLRKSLLPELCHAVKEQWYKVIAEALRALAEVPRFFVLGYMEGEDEATRENDRKEVADQLHAAVEPLLAAHDVDQEIKECALKASASLLSFLHASLSSDQSTKLLSLLLDRLNNETTRAVAIRTVATVAGAESGCDLSPILADSIKTMASFLRLQSRSLKQNALEALDIMIINHGSCMDFADGELYSSVLGELAPHISDKDLHLSHLSLYVLSTIDLYRILAHIANNRQNSFLLSCQMRHRFYTQSLSCSRIGCQTPYSRASVGTLYFVVATRPCPGFVVGSFQADHPQQCG